jgi:hypothetical protein
MILSSSRYSVLFRLFMFLKDEIPPDWQMTVFRDIMQVPCAYTLDYSPLPPLSDTSIDDKQMNYFPPVTDTPLESFFGQTRETGTGTS